MVLSQKLAKIEQIAYKLGYTIIAGKENVCIFSTKTIVLNMRQSRLKRAWTTAHEVAHALTLKKCIKEIGLRSVSGANHEWPSLEAEFRAWKTTDRLMRKLNMYSPEYLKYKHACIRSYYCAHSR